MSKKYNNVNLPLKNWLNERYGNLFELYSKILQPDFPEIFNLIMAELTRQCNYINLIASESLPSEAVLTAYSSISHNQTIEGNIEYRYFPETWAVDIIEELASTTATKLFNLPYANVQPHSATQANQATMHSVLNPGDKILVMDLPSGGHISHGFGHSLAKRLYEIHVYRVDEKDGMIDYNLIGDALDKIKPKLIISGSSSYPRNINFQKISEMAIESGTYHLADISHIAGLVCSNNHPGIESADFATLSLHKTMCGPRGGIVLCQEKYSKEMNLSVFPCAQGAFMPNLLVAKTIALLEAKKETFKKFQTKIINNARSLAKGMLDKGIDVLTGGTDTHLVIIRAPSPLDGNVAQKILQHAGVLSNKNHIPGDKIENKRVGGIRFGLTLVTQLGFSTNDAEELGSIIGEILIAKDKTPYNMRSKLMGLLTSVLERENL